MDHIIVFGEAHLLRILVEFACRSWPNGALLRLDASGCCKLAITLDVLELDDALHCALHTRAGTAINVRFPT